VKVFDTPLAAVANVYEIGSILTFNREDFKRYTNIKALDPTPLAK
jgi:predicted nucleic acid-binding protein